MRIPEDSPRMWGEEFIRTLKQIGQLPASELEELLEEGASQKIRVRSFSPGENRPVPSEWAGAIMGKLNRVLEKASITDHFKLHIADTVLGQLTSGMHRMVGTQIYLVECGLNPDNNQWGIFDPELSRGVEKEAIRLNRPYRRLTGDPTAHHNKMDRWWVADYVATYGENPEEISS